MTAGMGAQTALAVLSAVPSIKRRLAAFVYEGVLLFGVLVLATYLYSSLTQQRHALQGKPGLQAFLFVVLGIYFVWFWARSGQTVAMKAWHIRLVRKDGSAVSQAQALLRYVLAYLWFMPALVAAWLSPVTTPVFVFVLLSVGVITYAGCAALHPRRQFWHDALAGTELITWRPSLPNAK
jgi:uncharacterized RDD family membrane protein YckC